MELVLTVLIVALVFEYINGFHDTANSIATVVSTKVLTPRLAIVLAARFRKPLPIVLGILVATLLNHAVAASFGYLIAQWLTGHTFQIVLGVAFIAMAAWALIPDKEDEGAGERSSGGVFLTTLIAFFLVEIGDKTQIATSLLAAKFQSVALVTVGTTAGMMLANVPAVFLGEAVTRIVPMKVVRSAAAVIFAAIGLWIVVAGIEIGRAHV